MPGAKQRILPKSNMQHWLCYWQLGGEKRQRTIQNLRCGR